MEKDESKSVYEVIIEETVTKAFYVKADSKLEAKEVVCELLVLNPDAGSIDRADCSSVDEWEVIDITDQDVPDSMIDNLEE